MVSGVDAIRAFRGGYGERFVVRKGELQFLYTRNLTFWESVQGKFGRGNASLKKVANYVHEHRHTLFPTSDKATSIENRDLFNALINTYNQERCLSFKKARDVGVIDAEITFFGKEDWAKIGYDVTDAPPLPPNFQEICNTPCPFWPDKTIGDTHMLVLIPKKLGPKDTTINRLQKIKHNYCIDPHNPRFFRILSDDDGHLSYSESYWVLMTKEVIPGSLKQRLIDGKEPEDYSYPRMIEACICMLIQYITKQSSFIFNKTATWTEEQNICGDYSVIGMCDDKGFDRYHSADEAASHIGLAVVKRFYK